VTITDEYDEEGQVVPFNQVIPDEGDQENLHDWLEGHLPYEQPDWRPESLDDAARTLRRLLRLGDKAEEWEEVARAERARIDDWLAARLSTIAAERGWLERSLRSYMKVVDTKTLDLPAGIARLRQRRWTVEVTDVAALTAWAEQNAPELVERHVPKSKVYNAVKPSPAEVDVDREVASAITGGGEVVPGVRMVRVIEDSFSYRSAKEADYD